MRAALKRNVISCTIFRTHYDTYPEWFMNEMIESAQTNNCYLGNTDIDEYTGFFYEKPYIEEDTVFIRNENDIVMPTDFETFNDMYYMLDPFTAALKRNCVDVFIFDTTKHNVRKPKWVEDAIDDGIIYRTPGDVLMFFEPNGEIALSPVCVFMRNKKGLIKYIEPEKFFQYFKLGGDYENDE